MYIWQIHDLCQSFSAFSVSAIVDLRLVPWGEPVCLLDEASCGVPAPGCLDRTFFALFLKPIAWVVFGGVLLVLLLGTIWPWLAVKGLKAEFEFAESPVSEGDCSRISLTITNRWPWPVWGLSLESFFLSVRDQGENSFGESNSAAVVSLARVSGWSTSRFRWTVTPSCRGIYPKETPALATSFPFGFWSRVASIKALLCRSGCLNEMLPKLEWVPGTSWGPAPNPPGFWRHKLRCSKPGRVMRVLGFALLDRFGNSELSLGWRTTCQRKTK